MSSESFDSRVFYSNKAILAPMVRVSTLPNRLLALRHGADIVYSEEIIDHKLLSAKRVVNDVLNTIDYRVDGLEYPIFRTCEEEKGKVVFQIGTSDAVRALNAARMVEQDVAAIDVNMGCPKEFSIKGGMGAALLKMPDKIQEILTTLVQGVAIPVTCKIRILPELEETLELCRMIERCGVKAIAVHGRLKEERPQHKNHEDVIREVSRTLSIPVIANGGSDTIRCRQDVERFWKRCGAASALVARAAMWNMSIFREEGTLDLEEVMSQYVKLVSLSTLESVVIGWGGLQAIEYDNEYHNTKYCLQQMLHEQLETERGKKLQSAMCAEQIFALYGMDEHYREFQKEILRRSSRENEASTFTVIEGKDGPVISLPAKFIRQHYPHQTSPKVVLFDYCRDKRLPRPIYSTECHCTSKKFFATVDVDGQKYSSSLGEGRKHYAEQSAGKRLDGTSEGRHLLIFAAIVCLTKLGVADGRHEKKSS